MKIPVNKPLLSGKELQYVSDCIRSGWISSAGQYVEKFEKEFAKQCNRKFCITVTNGTTALEIALRSLYLKPGDEIILPSFTIISCLTEILNQKLIPVFIDTDLETWNIDIEKIETFITPKTKCILIPHIYGFPVQMDKINLLCEKYKISLIEDSAEMHGQTFNNKPCGSFGDISTFSFFANKIITMGEGGAILTNDEKLAHKIKLLKNLGFKEPRYIHDVIGTNARLTNLQAAVGCAQLEKIESLVSKKRRIGNRYYKAFKDAKNFKFQQPEMNFEKNIYWVCGIIAEGKKEVFINELKKYDIDTRSFFYPLDKQPLLSRYDFEINQCPNAMYMYQNGFYIPSGLGLTDEEQDYVITKLLEIDAKI